MLRRSFSMLRGQRCGQLSGRASNCAYRDSFFRICASSPNRPQITQIYAGEIKTEPANRTDDIDSQGADGLPTRAWSSGSAFCDLL